MPKQSTTFLHKMILNHWSIYPLHFVCHTQVTWAWWSTIVSLAIWDLDPAWDLCKHDIPNLVVTKQDTLMKGTFCLNKYKQEMYSYVVTYIFSARVFSEPEQHVYRSCLDSNQQLSKNDVTSSFSRSTICDVILGVLLQVFPVGCLSEIS